MEEYRLFYTPVWRASVAERSDDWPIARQIMVDKIYSLAESESGVEKTNFGGWQSTDALFEHPEFAWLLNNLIAMANEIVPKFGTDKTINDGHLWANLNRKGDFNAMHNHPDSFLSGAVYLKYEREEQGVIEFFDAREGSPTSTWACYMQLDEHNDTTEAVHTVVPREGDVLFFPGWLKHWVSPNTIDSDRISISFNMSIRE